MVLVLHTHRMESGEPVNVTERSGMPPLSVRKGGKTHMVFVLLKASRKKKEGKKKGGEEKKKFN